MNLWSYPRIKTVIFFLYINGYVNNEIASPSKKGRIFFAMFFREYYVMFKFMCYQCRSKFEWNGPKLVAWTSPMSAACLVIQIYWPIVTSPPFWSCLFIDLQTCLSRDRGQLAQRFFCLIIWMRAHDICI